MADLLDLTQVIPPLEQRLSKNYGNQGKGNFSCRNRGTIAGSSTAVTATSRERLAKKLGVTSPHYHPQGPRIAASALGKKPRPAIPMRPGSSIRKQTASKATPPKPPSSFKKQANQQPKTECILYEDSIF